MLIRSSFCPRAIPTLAFLSRPRTAMPLRSKILNPTFSPRQTMSTSTIPVIPEPNTSDDVLFTIPVIPEPNTSDDVLFNSNLGVRTIELNRPEKFNALNQSMAQKIVPRLQEWAKSQIANIIILKGAGPKALCAGGDVDVLAQLCSTGTEGQQKATAFFGLEYQLNHLIATYKKPYIAFMDGVTMGGGVGLSVHAPFRIATERTMFAMPETKIGFFPDVGGSFFLPRLDGQIGTYLALTSDRLVGVQALYAGIATHYIHSSSLPDIEQRLSELVFDDNATSEEKCNIVNSTIEEFVTGLPDEPIKLAGTVREAIDRCFSFNKIEDILAALEAEKTDWAASTLATIRERSPTSVRVSLRLMRLGLGFEWTISEAFQREYSVAARFMAHPDFVEGVTALFSKRKPQWSPPTIEETTEEAAAAFVTPEPGERRLELLAHGENTSFTQYPHVGIGLPTEAEVKGLLAVSKLVERDVVRWFIGARSGKLGVEQKVLDIIKRKTKAVEGFVKWVE